MGRLVKLILVMALYLVDRFLSLTGVPFLQISVWGSVIREAFDAIVYFKFWLRILIVISLVKISLSRFGKKREDIFIVRPKPLDVALGLLFFLGLLLATNIMEGLWSSYRLPIQRGVADVLLASAVGSWAAFLILFLPAAFYEEIFYSFILVHLSAALGSSKIGTATAILATSVLFGLTHLYLGELAFLMSFVRRIFYCLILLWRKNLAAPVTAHALFNFNAIIPLG